MNRLVYQETGLPITKETVAGSLIRWKWAIRKIMARVQHCRDTIKGLRRHWARLEARGVAVLKDERPIEQLREIIQNEKDSMGDPAGRIVLDLLDLYRQCGATNHDLFQICGVNPAHVAKLMSEHEQREDPDFLALIFVHGIELKDLKSEWLDFSQDMPFKHAITEYISNGLKLDPFLAHVVDMESQKVVKEMTEDPIRILKAAAPETLYPAPSPLASVPESKMMH